MTDFKYGSNNYPRKLSAALEQQHRSSTATSATMNNNLTTTNNVHSFVDETKRPPQHHSRLKKSLSECEYYDDNRPASCTLGMERNFNLSPSKRVRVGGDRHIDEIAFIEPGNNQRLYNYDTMKSQYLLQQQQKLKEYKNDPNYPGNCENYGNDVGMVETKGILKNSTRTLTPCSDTTTTAGTLQRNSLKRNKGLSTLSLCSCDADTEVSFYPEFYSKLIVLMFDVVYGTYGRFYN